MVFVLEYNISKLYYYISEEGEAIVVQQLFLLHYVAKLSKAQEAKLTTGKLLCSPTMQLPRQQTSK